MTIHSTPLSKMDNKIPVNKFQEKFTPRKTLLFESSLQTIEESDSRTSTPGELPMGACAITPFLANSQPMLASSQNTMVSVG